MMITTASVSERNSFWVSLLIHVLLFAVYLLTLMQHHSPLPEKKPALYVPSYVYNTAPLVTAAAQTAQKQTPVSHDQLNLAQPLAQPNTAQFKPATAYKHAQPVHMIGEKLVDDPLKKLLGIAISKHLSYPQVAQELNMRGRVAVGFTLFPDGSVTNVEMMQTSHEPLLDAAAMAAIREMAPVDSVAVYLKQPRFLVVNVIFR